MGGALDRLQVLQYVVHYDHCIQRGVAQKDHVMIAVIHCKVLKRGVAHCRMVVQDHHCELVGVADQY